MTNKVLVKWKNRGFVIMTIEEWRDYKDTCKRLKKRFSICDNEFHEHEYLNGQQLRNELSSNLLDDEQASALIKLFGQEFGCVSFNDGCINDFLENDEPEHDSYKDDVSDFLRDPNEDSNEY